MIFLDPVERDEYDEVIDSVALSSYAKDVEKELGYFNDYKLKVCFP